MLQNILVTCTLFVFISGTSFGMPTLLPEDQNNISSQESINQNNEEENNGGKNATKNTHHCFDTDCVSKCLDDYYKKKGKPIPYKNPSDEDLNEYALTYYTCMTAECFGKSINIKRTATTSTVE